MAETIANLKEKILGDKDGAFARANPKLFEGINRLTTFIEDEQNKVTTGFEEIKEQVKMVSVKSMFQLRRTQANVFKAKKASRPAAESSDSSSNTMGVLHKSSMLSDMFQLDNTSPPLKEETLVKQGKDQLWRERHFVLRNEGVVYYENLKAYQTNPTRPKGKILFCDLICPSGQAADAVPKFVYFVLGKPFVFCLHAEDTTFVVAAGSKEALKAWIAAINSAFNTFVQSQAKKSALMDAAWTVGSPDVFRVVNKLAATSASMDQVLGELFMIMLDQFEQEVVEVRRNYQKKRLLQEWREAAQIKRKQRELSLFQPSKLKI